MAERRVENYVCMWKSGVAEKNVRGMVYWTCMKDDSLMTMRCAAEINEGFEVKVGLPHNYMGLDRHGVLSYLQLSSIHSDR